MFEDCEKRKSLALVFIYSIKVSKVFAFMQLINTYRYCIAEVILSTS